LRLTWGLNPLANEFEPKSFQPSKKPTQTTTATITSSPTKSKPLTVQTSTTSSDVQPPFVPAGVPLHHGPLAGSVPPGVARNLRPVPVVLASPPGMRFGGPMRPQFPGGGFGVPPPSVLGPDYHAAVSPLPIPNQPGLVRYNRNIHFILMKITYLCKYFSNIFWCIVYTTFSWIPSWSSDATSSIWND